MITTTLKAVVQARIDAATTATSLTDLMLLRKAAAGLFCNESNLDTLLLAAVDEMDGGTTLKDLLLANKAGALTASSVDTGMVIYSVSDDIEFEYAGGNYLRSGFAQTDITKFDQTVFKEKIVPPGAVKALVFSVVGSVSSEVAYGDTPAGPVCVWATSDGAVHSSTDGLLTVNTKTNVFPSTGSGSVAGFLNGFFVIAAAKNVRSSADALTWTAKNWAGAAAAPRPSRLLYGNGWYVIVNSNVQAEQSLVVTNNLVSGAWVVPNTQLGATVSDATFHAGYFVMLLANGDIVRSVDFVTFEKVGSIGNVSGVSIASGNGVLIVILPGEGTMKSDDGGFTWQSISTSRGGANSKLQFDGEVFLYVNSGLVADKQGVWSSFNGINWVRSLAAPIYSDKFTATPIAFISVLQGDPSGTPALRYYPPMVRFAGSITPFNDGAANQYVRIK